MLRNIMADKQEDKKASADTLPRANERGGECILNTILPKRLIDVTVSL
jgi:hypothetical protein